MNDDQNLQPNKVAEIKTDDNQASVSPLMAMVDDTQTPNLKTSPVGESISDKIIKAREAMEGPSRTLKREERETEHRVKDEKSDLQAELDIIGKDKERLEINWVVLDKKQAEIKKLLDPIKQEEDKLETTEEETESREHTTSDVKDRQKIEQDRWAIQDKRKDLEKRKWELEDKILEIEHQLETNTTEYQELLDKEEVINKKIETLDYEIAIAKEKIALQAEEETRTKEAQVIAEEQQKREARLQVEAKKSADEKEADLARLKTKADLEKKLTAENVTVAGNTTPTQKPATVDTVALNERADDRLRAILAAQKEKVELAKAKQAELTKKPESAIPTVSINQPNEKIKAELLQSARLAATANSADIKPVEKTPLTVKSDFSNLEAEDKKPALEKYPEPEKTPAPKMTPTPDSDEEVPSYSPNEKSSLPVIRTFKGDINTNSNLTQNQIKEATKKFPWLKP